MSDRESRARDTLIKFQNDYPGALNEDNISDIIHRAEERLQEESWQEHKPSILEKLKHNKQIIKEIDEQSEGQDQTKKPRGNPEL